MIAAVKTELLVRPADANGVYSEVVATAGRELRSTVLDRIVWDATAGVIGLMIYAPVASASGSEGLWPAAPRGFHVGDRVPPYANNLMTEAMDRISYGIYTRATMARGSSTQTPLPDEAHPFAEVMLLNATTYRSVFGHDYPHDVDTMLLDFIRQQTRSVLEPLARGVGAILGTPQTARSWTAPASIRDMQRLLLFNRSMLTTLASFGLAKTEGRVGFDTEKGQQYRDARSLPDEEVGVRVVGAKQLGTGEVLPVLGVNRLELPADKSGGCPAFHPVDPDLCSERNLRQHLEAAASERNGLLEVCGLPGATPLVHEIDAALTICLTQGVPTLLSHTSLASEHLAGFELPVTAKASETLPF